MQKIGKAFGDMPGLSEMFAGAQGGPAARVGAGAAEDGDEGEEVDSAFLAAAMEGDLAAVKKFISDAAAGMLLSPSVLGTLQRAPACIGFSKGHFLSCARSSDTVHMPVERPQCNQFCF